MFGEHSCSACLASLQPADGHDMCPACLGPEHLREGLSEDSCMNCSFMPRAVRASRLAEVEHLLGQAPEPGQLTPAQQSQAQPSRPKRRAAETAGASSGRRAKESKLASKVDQLTEELNQMKSLVLAIRSGTGAGDTGAPAPPTVVFEPEDDALSLVASATEFADYGADTVPQDTASGHGSGVSSRSSAHSGGTGSEDNSMGVIIRMALARLQLDVPQVQPAPASAFFRRGPAPATFTVPPSEEYLRELHACWRDTRALSHTTSDGRTLAAMQDAAKFGLARMPAVEPAIAALVVSPEEALRPDARCPRPQCRVTDDLLAKAYDAAARMGRIGNSLSHLMLALSASLQEATVDASVHSFGDASLQAFALMSRELGRLMSTLVQARRQVWLAQSPLTETCRRTLCSVPVEPGEVFGSAALEALERTVQARQTRQQLSGLHRSMPPSRPGGFAAPPQRRSRPQTSPTISSRHARVDGNTVGCHRLVSLFLKGALRLRPPQAQRAPVWDLPLVLDALCLPPFEPLAQAELKWVSAKTAFLLAITSARRVGELHALSVSESCLRWNSDGSGVTLWPNAAFLPKVLSPSNLNRPIHLAQFTPPAGEEKSGLLCPVWALRVYVSLTTSMRRSEQLFLCYGGPKKGCALSKQRLSHWVVDAITQAYRHSGRPLPSGVRCHSTRAVATSWAALRGVPLQDICDAASWASPTTFSRFYRVNVATPHPLGVALLPTSTASSH
ncbi:hypothetical protein N1851_009418 [Merluccius polli]|uniref:Tyr recombinase domain-containing protein n=2 Tax=Merluccius polli TaxID=89951 RepID=A0AA47P6B2_MERPO|nr:hypothetical protein N1851_009418 [Merluccius polli]